MLRGISRCSLRNLSAASSGAKFPQYNAMLNDLKLRWCDGIPGSASETDAENALENSVASLLKYEIIKSAQDLSREELHFAWQYSCDSLLAQRRINLRDRWYQPAVMFICKTNADLSQLSAAWMNTLTQGQIWTISASFTPGKHLNELAVESAARTGIISLKSDPDDPYTPYFCAFPKPVSQTFLNSMDSIYIIGNIIEENAQLQDVAPSVQIIKWNDDDLLNTNVNDIDSLNNASEILKRKVLEICKEKEILPCDT